MGLRQKIAIIYVVVAAILSIICTILQIQPALYIIELTQYEGKFYIALVFLLTFLVFLLPFILFAIVRSLLLRTKNSIPDLTGRTGVLLKRKRVLYDAINVYTVLVDGTASGKISNGKEFFIELLPGNHSIELKGFSSSKFEFIVEQSKVTRLITKVDDKGLVAKVFIEYQE